MSFEISMTAIKGLQGFFETAPELTNRSMMLALNGAIRFGYAESSREMRKQVNFPQDYIGSASVGNRLVLTELATREKLSARIAAKQRAVSLARFAADRSLGRRRDGVTVTVKPGHPVTIPKAFLLPLKAGASLTQDSYNIGLAIRLRPGEKLQGRYAAKRYGADPNLYLLFGPSVDQVFNDTRDKVEPAIVDYFTAEFYRQFERGVR